MTRWYTWEYSSENIFYTITEDFIQSKVKDRYLISEYNHIPLIRSRKPYIIDGL